MTRDFKNKLVVITGASSGIGRALLRSDNAQRTEQTQCDVQSAQAPRCMWLAQARPYLAKELSEQVEGFANAVKGFFFSDDRVAALTNLSL